MPQQHSSAEQPKQKRAYRKGKPLTLAERQQAYLERKRQTHALVKVSVRKELKEILLLRCEERGLTQGELIEELLKKL